MTTRRLHLADNFSLPQESVTRTFGILAVRGAGKSNTAAVMAEEMCAAGLPFVVVDPVGCWFGLRSGADGSRDGGLPVPIFGGKHGDMPLERGAGELLADLVVEKRLSCVLDLSRFDSEGDKKAFLLAFGRRLYLKNEDPLHLFLEEADDYIPQRPMRDEAQLLRAWENIVRRGRSRGLGITLITQRSASVNKMVLTQVETLFAMRTTGPQDIAAIEAWVKYHQVNDEVVSSLATLKDGEAWVWSPSFLGLVERHQIRRRRTFDSGAAPKNFRGDANKKPATLADVDLSALREQMAATIEKAKAEDPRELRRQIADLKKQLSSTPVSLPTARKATSTPVLTDADRALLDRLHGRLSELAAKLGQNRAERADRLVGQIGAAVESATRTFADQDQAWAEELGRILEGVGLQKVLGKLAGGTERGPEQQRGIPAAGQAGALAGRVAPRSRPPLNDAPSQNRARPTAEGALSDGTQQRTVDTIAMLNQRGIEVTREAVARWMGIHPNGGRYLAGLAQLRAEGYLERWLLTARGQAVARPLDTGIDATVAALKDGTCRRSLEELVRAHPRALTREHLAQQMQIHPNGGRFLSGLAWLRQMGVISGRSPISVTDGAFR